MNNKTIEPIKADFDALASALVSGSKTIISGKKTDNFPITEYPGALPIGDIVLECAVLEDERRVIDATSIFTAFGRPRKGANSRLEIDGTKIPPFLAAKGLKPFINQQVIERTKLIEYRDGGRLKTGYDAKLLRSMCSLYLEARRAGALLKSQERLAVQSEIILSALGDIGIEALVDEATGYQRVRKYDALRVLLQKYVGEGMAKWVKTFPDAFFAELDRLYDNEPTTSRNRPKYYGRFINTYIYEPLERGHIKTELDRINKKEDGKKRGHLHRWLTEEGKIMLVHQLGRTQGLMELCPDIKTFREKVKKRKEISIAPYLFEEMNRII